MSASKGPNRTNRLYLLVSLAVLSALLYFATKAAPVFREDLGTIAAIGFLSLAGALLAELVEVAKVPHLTGYLLAGLIAGPHVLHLIDHGSVVKLQGINALALALIALGGGAELRIDLLKSGFKSLSWATLLQTFGGLAMMTVVFFVCRPLMPFTKGMPIAMFIGVAILWGVLSITRSPSAALGILSQTRAQGPLARYSLSFVMASDVVVVIVLATALTLVRPLILPGASMSAATFTKLGHEILGSVALGTTLGLVLAVYLRLVGKQLVVVLVALGFGATEVLNYLHFEPLLTFLVAGFVVQNLSKQGHKLLHSVEEMGGIVYVIFFATAGAHLDVPLLRQLWKVAVALCVSRAALTWALGRVASRIANDPPVLKKWAFAPLVSQAGIALGIGSLIAREFPMFGADFRALSVAAVAINEMVGPVLFKFALDTTGESRGPAPALPDEEASMTGTPLPVTGTPSTPPSAADS